MERLHIFLLRYNVFIACCAVALVLYFSMLHRITVSPYLLVFAFSGTLAVYQFFRNYRSLKNFIRDRYSISFLLISLSSIVCLACYLAMPDILMACYLLPVLLSAAYKFRIAGTFALRKIPFLKAVVISVVWVLMAVIPLFEQGNEEYIAALVFPSAVAQFFFFMAICIPFDVFDADADDFKTFATAMGARKAMYLAGIFLLAYLCIHVACDETTGDIAAHAGVSLLTFATFLVYRRLHRRRARFYLVDGAIMLQVILLYVSRIL